MKCEYLTRQEQQLQLPSEWDQPPHLDSDAVTLQLPYGSPPVQTDPSLFHVPTPTASTGHHHYNSAMMNVASEPMLMNDGSWSTSGVPQQYGAQCFYGAGVASTGTVPQIVVDPNQQVMGYSNGHLLQVPARPTAQGSPTDWYPTQDPR